MRVPFLRRHNINFAYINRIFSLMRLGVAVINIESSCSMAEENKWKPPGDEEEEEEEVDEAVSKSIA